jgi:hypothetical protein
MPNFIIEYVNLRAGQRKWAYGISCPALRGQEAYSRQSRSTPKAKIPSKKKGITVYLGPGIRQNTRKREMGRYGGLAKQTLAEGADRTLVHRLLFDLDARQKEVQAAWGKDTKERSARS